MNTAIFSFIGIIVGASLQYFYSRHLEQQRHHRDLRSKAYTDYLKSVCDQANLAHDRHSPEEREISAKTADAKCRICVYGSSDAIEAFARFERLGATMTSEVQCLAFARMVSIMRRDSLSKGLAVLDDLQVVLLGNHPPKM